MIRTTAAKKTKRENLPRGVIQHLTDFLPDHRYNILYPRLGLQLLGRLAQTCRAFRRDLAYKHDSFNWIPADWRKTIRKEPSLAVRRAMQVLIHDYLRPAKFFGIPRVGETTRLHVRAESVEVEVYLTKETLLSLPVFGHDDPVSVPLFHERLRLSLASWRHAEALRREYEQRTAIETKWRAQLPEELRGLSSLRLKQHNEKRRWEFVALQLRDGRVGQWPTFVEQYGDEMTRLSESITRQRQEIPLLEQRIEAFVAAKVEEEWGLTHPKG
jgi:hypothetical protein